MGGGDVLTSEALDDLHLVEVERADGGELIELWGGWVGGWVVGWLIELWEVGGWVGGGGRRWVGGWVGLT